MSANTRPWPNAVREMIERISPLYHTYTTGSEQDSDILELMDLVSADQPMPVTFYAAINVLLLRDHESPLAQFYPYLTPDPYPAREAWPNFRHFCLTHATELRELLPTFRLQTNEVTRSANLLPAFELVSQRGGRKPLILIEIGCSAGLNLFWDQYGYTLKGTGRYGSIGAGDPSSPVQIVCTVQSEQRLPIPQTMPIVAQRIGIDLHPLHISNPHHVRLLRGAIWPEELHRYRLLDAALTLARTLPPPSILAGDASLLLQGVLDDLPEEEQTICLSHSYALRQGPQALRERIEAICARTSQTQPLYRVSLEMEPAEWSAPRLELFTYQDGTHVSQEWLASCDIHGTHMQWHLTDCKE